MMIDEMKRGGMEQAGVVSLPLSIVAEGIERRYLRDIEAAEVEEKQQFVEEMSDYLQRFLSQPKPSGGAEEWHNLSVTLAQSKFLDLACDVLDKGLEFYPKNVDLLADYLRYGVECGRMEQCETACKTLCRIPHKLWSWRCYQFLISYHISQMEGASAQKLEKIEAELLNLVKEYRIQFPDNEGSYDCEADVYEALHDPRREEALQEGMKALRLAPKCAMQMGIILFERGDYEGALNMIQRALRQAVQVQMSVNESHLYYMCGLSKLGQLMLEENGYPEEKVRDIYSDFETSLCQGHLAVELREVMKQRAISLQIKSGIDVPEKYTELKYLLG